MYYIFIHSSVDGHLSHFCVLAILNSAMNIGCKYIFYFWMCLVFLAAYMLSLVAMTGDYSLLQRLDLLQWLVLLRSSGSVIMTQDLSFLMAQS